MRTLKKPSSGTARILAPLMLAAVLGACQMPKPQDLRPQPISMAALHDSGGVPPKWQFKPPMGNVAAGRRAFADFGCGSCHHIEGESFAASGQTGIGPDLTGMGSHHPPAYFVESILNPDAVLVDGPGYIGPDGHSIMPAYRDMTLAQLADIVTYLESLRQPAAQHVHSHWRASSFFVQVDELTPDEFDELEDWFASTGPQTLKAVPGFVSVDTYVSRTPTGRLVVSVFGFEDDAVLHDFGERLSDRNPRAELGLARASHAPLYRSTTVYRFPLMCVP